MEVLMEVQATCKSIEAWISQPDGLVKSLPQIHDDILFDRAVTAQINCPKKVQFTAYSTPALAAVGPDGLPLEGVEPHPYRYLPTKKEILAYAAAAAETIASDAPFDIVTRDLLYVFPNGRARLGGMQAEPTQEFSTAVVYRHRPEVSTCDV
jgi:hypothetical protein